MLDKIESLIAEHGVAVVCIFADVPRGLPSLNYSVGLQDRGWPEIVITGVGAVEAMAIVNQCIKWASERGEPPAEGEIIGEGLLGDGYQARFRALSPHEVKCNLFMAIDRSAQMGREPPEALQIVYQDPERRWPEDAGYSCGIGLLLSQGKETRQ